MTKVYLIGGFAAALILGIWYHIQLAQENARLEQEIAIANESARVAKQDAESKANRNTELRQRIEDIRYETEQLREDLAALPRTQIQRDCDAAPLPTGYVERLLQADRQD